MLLNLVWIVDCKFILYIWCGCF